MRKVLIAILAVAASMSVTKIALAADMPVKAASYAAPVAPFNWTGLYIGANVGAGWGEREGTLTFLSSDNLVQTRSYGISGFMGGVQGGYNWQLPTMPVVFGIEGSFDWADIHGTSNCIFGWTCDTKVNQVADVAGRLGFTVDRALVYVKAGYAWADVEQNLALTSTTANGSHTRSGRLLGAGVEYAFMPNWSAKVEYNYIDFRNETLNVVNSGSGNTYALDLRQPLSAIKFGLNYNFMTR